MFCCFLGSLISWFTSSLVHWLIASFVHCFFCSLVGWFIDSYIRWFIASLLHWLIDSLTCWFVDSLLRWFSDGLIQCFVPSFSHCDSLAEWLIDSSSHSLIHCFLLSSVNWLIDSFVHWLVNCAWVISFHFIRTSATMCPFIDALHNFHTSMILHLKNFPIGTLGHLLPRLVLYSRNFPRRGPGTPWKLVASLPGPTEFGAAEPNALSLLASVTQEETYHGGWCLPPTKMVIQVVLGMVYGIRFTTLLPNRVSFIYIYIYHFWTLPAVWCGFRHKRRSNWFLKPVLA